MKNQTSGFTLIELLVVVSVMALLISLLLPALELARSEAQTVICASNHRQYGLSFQMYADDNTDAFPMFADNFPSPSAASYWYVISAEYISADPKDNPLNADYRQCPAGAAVGVPYGGFNNLRYPSRGTGYTPNSPILYGSLGSTVFPPYTFKQVRFPDTWAMLLDVDAARNYMYTFANDGWRPDTDTDGDNLADTHSRLLNFMPSTQYNGARPRIHRDMSNMAMVDGHVERIGYMDFIDFTSNFWRDDI